MPYGITQCYLPPDSGEIPAFTPSRSRYLIQWPQRDTRLSWPTYVTWKPTGRELNPRPVNRKSNALPLSHHGTIVAIDREFAMRPSVTIVNIMSEDAFCMYQWRPSGILSVRDVVASWSTRLYQRQHSPALHQSRHPRQPASVEPPSMTWTTWGALSPTQYS